MTAEAYFAATQGTERDAYLESLTPEALLRLGIDLYNAGHYWNAHEAWEQVWLDAPRELRAFYQGLIQLTAALVHVTRAEYPGSVRLLAAAIDKLQVYESPTLGVDVTSLVDGARKALSRLQEVGDRGIGEFEMTLVPRIRRTQG